MKSFNKILLFIVLLLTVSISSFSQKGQFNVNYINWVNAKQLEKISITRIPSEQIISGDSIILYSGQPAILQDMYIKQTTYLTPYVVTGSTDTVKIYGTYNNIPVEVAYISDSLYTSIIPNVTYSATNIGRLDGTLYYIIMPAGKFSAGDSYSDVYCKFTVFK